MVSRLIITLLLLAPPALAWTGADWAAMLELSAMRGPLAEAAPDIEVSTNCMAQLRFTVSNEVASGYYRDYSGWNNHGTQSIAACRGTWVTNGGGAVQLDGITNYVVLAGPASYQSTGMTVMAWFKTDKLGDATYGNAFINRTGLSGSNYGWLLYSISSFIYFYGSVTGSDLPLQASSGSGSYQTNVWFHLAGTHSLNGDGKLRIYINGVYKGISVQAKAALFSPTNIPVTFGSTWENDGNRFHRCIIDDGRIYNTPLTEAEIGLIYSNTVGRY